MIILNQIKYRWSSEGVTQHSSLTLTARAFNPHHAAQACEAVRDQRSDTPKTWGVGVGQTNFQPNQVPDHTYHLAEHLPELVQT